MSHVSGSQLQSTFVLIARFPPLAEAVQLLGLLLFFGTAEAATNLSNGLSQASSELGDLPRPKEQE